MQQHRNLKLIMILGLLGILALTGCGETLRGIGRDASRVGHGIKTIFISGN